MPRNTNPWTKFHHRDYLTDMQRLRCSLAARGAWAELLAWFFADKTDRFDGPPDELARMVGASVEEALKAVEELLTKGVCDGEITLDEYGCPANVLIVSRRLSKELTQRESDKKRKADYRKQKMSDECPEDFQQNSAFSASVHASVSSGEGESEGKGNGLTHGRLPDGSFLRPDHSPEFLAMGTLWQSEVGGIFDRSRSWDAWSASDLSASPDLQIEVSDLIREQGRWREIARQDELRIPSPVKFSNFIIDQRWTDRPWSDELKALVEDEDGEPDPLDPAREMKL